MRTVFRSQGMPSSSLVLLGSTLNKLRVSPAHWRQMPNSGPPSQSWPPVYTRVHTPASVNPRGLGCSRDATNTPHAASRQAVRARCTAGRINKKGKQQSSFSSCTKRAPAWVMVIVFAMFRPDNPEWSPPMNPGSRQPSTL